MLIHRLRQRARQFFGQAARRSERSSRSRRLAIEMLEDRALPSGTGVNLQIDGLSNPFAIQSASLNRQSLTGQAGTSPQLISFTAPSGADSPVLLLDASDGMPFKDSPVLTVPIDGQAIQWKLVNAFVSSFSTNSLTDTFSLQFDSVQASVPSSGSGLDLTGALAALSGQPAGESQASSAGPTPQPTETLQFSSAISPSGVQVFPVTLGAASWGVSRQAISTGAGSAQPRDFRVTLLQSDQEAALLHLAVAGKPNDDVFLTTIANGQEVQWTLARVTIPSATTSFGAGGGTDTISLHFDAIQESVTPVDASGTATGPAVTDGWDFRVNQATSLSATPATNVEAGTILVPTTPVTEVLAFEGLDQSLAVESYSWGASRSTSTSPPVAQDFNLVSSPSSLDPQLLLAAASGQQSPSAVLTVEMGSAQITWTLANVSISSFTTGQGSGNGPDSLDLHFDFIKETVTRSTGGAPDFQFDFATNDALTTPSVKLPGPMPLAASLPTTGPVTEMLQLPTVSDANAANSLSVLAYSWGVSQHANVTGTPSAHPRDFNVILPASSDDPVFLMHAADGGVFANAYLTIGDNSSQIQWALANVSISSLNTGIGMGGGSESLQLHFDAIQESVAIGNAQTITVGWDFKARQPTTLDGPPKPGPEAVQVFTAGQVSTSLKADGLGTLPVEYLVWSETGQTKTSAAQASAFQIGLTAGTEAPLLLLYGADGNVFSTVTVTSQANGQQAQWTLANVTISSFNEGYATGGGTESLDLQFTAIQESVTVFVKGAKTTTTDGWDFQQNKVYSSTSSQSIALNQAASSGSAYASTPAIVADLTFPGAGPSKTDLKTQLILNSFGFQERTPAITSGIAQVQAGDVQLSLLASPEELLQLPDAVGASGGQVVIGAAVNGQLIQWILSDASISAFSTGLGIAGSGDGIGLHFESIQQSVTPVGPDGMPTGSTVTDGWDFTKGQPTTLQVVADTTTTLTSPALSDTFSTASQVGTLSASVGAAGTIVNEGTVTFTILDSNNNLVATLPDNPVARGFANATFNLAGLAVGSYFIHAAYVPATTNAIFTASADTSDGTLTITADSTTITATTSVFLATHTALYTQLTTFSATVTPGNTAAGGEVDEGIVVFTIFDSANTPLVMFSGTAISGGSGSAVYDLAGLPVGSYTLQASYVPSDTNPDFTASTSSNYCGFGITPYAILNLAQVSSSTTVTSAALSKTCPAAGQCVTFSAAVTNSGSGAVNEGTVTFSVLDSIGNVVATLAGNPVVAGGASVSYTLPELPAGKYDIHAAYVPAAKNPSYTASEDASDGTLTVAPADTTTTATGTGLADIYSTADQTVSLSAVVGAAGVAVNEGNVRFTVVDAQGNSIGASVTTDTVANGAASATFTLPGGTPAGSYFIHAAYVPAAGDPSFLASSDAGAGNLTALADTALVSLAAPGVVTAFVNTTQMVVLSAAVLPGNSAAHGVVNEGTITFTLLDAHDRAIGDSVTSGTVANGSASAVYTLPAHVATGSYQIRANYNPAPNSPNFLPGGKLTSQQALRVEPGTATAVTSSRLSRTFSTASDVVVLRAAVQPGKGTRGERVNEGRVTFTIVDSHNQAVATLPGNGVSKGSAGVRYDLAGLPAGNYHVHATYVPAITDPNFSASEDDRDGSLVIVRGQTRIVLTSARVSRPLSSASNVVTFSATVRPVSGPAGRPVNEGTITYVVLDRHDRVVATLADNTVSRGAASATFDLAGLPVGKYRLHAVYVPSAVNPDFIGSADLGGTLTIT
jgi:hypothetical protein